MTFWPADFNRCGFHQRETLQDENLRGYNKYFQKHEGNIQPEVSVGLLQNKNSVDCRVTFLKTLRYCLEAEGRQFVVSLWNNVPELQVKNEFKILVVGRGPKRYNFRDSCRAQEHD